MPDPGQQQQLQQALTAGNLSGAIQILLAMRADAPHDALIHTNLGIVYGAQNDRTNAEKHLREALRLQPATIDAHVTLGEICAKNGETANALSHYLAAHKLAPQAGLVLSNIAQLYAHMGQLDPAIDFATRALLADMGSGAATALAKLLLQAGRQAQALSLFKQYGNVANVDPKILMSFGQIFIQLQQRENALAAYDLFAERCPLTPLENVEQPSSWVAGNRFSAERPSPRYDQLIHQYELIHKNAQAQNSGSGQTFEGIVGFAIVAPYVRRFRTALNAKTMLDYGGGRGAQYRLGRISAGGEEFATSLAYLGLDQAVCFDPGFNQELPTESYDLVICVDALEHCDRQDLPWIVRRLFQKANLGVFANIASYAAGKALPNGENAHCTIEEAPWWMGLFAAVARDFPNIDYQVIVSKDLRQQDRVAFGHHTARKTASKLANTPVSS